MSITEKKDINFFIRWFFIIFSHYSENAENYLLKKSHLDHVQFLMYVGIDMTTKNCFKL